MTQALPQPASCVCCGSVRWRRLKKTDWAVHRCDACGHVSALDPFAAAKTEPLYGEQFATGHVHPTYSFANGRCQLRDGALWRARFAYLERLTGGPGRLLDVGCSVGMLLDLARSRGWTPQGIETSPWEVAYAREQLQLPVHDGLLQAGVFADASFDAIACSHTLEHVPDPAELIAQFRRVLRPGGAALIVVPTQFASLTWRLFARPVGEPPPRHVQFFTGATLRRLLRRQGFTVARSRMNLQLAYLARSFGSRGLSRKLEHSSTALRAVEGGRPGLRLARAAKALVNAAASAGDFGDELAIFAVRC